MSDPREQQQFLEVLDRDEAERRFHAALSLDPLPAERVPLDAALGRALAADVLAPVDVPGFDRSNVDGYAVRAEDTYDAEEERPRTLRRLDTSIATGAAPTVVVLPGCAAAIATGGMLPRGADAVVMVEHTDLGADGALRVRRPVTPGAHVTFAGTDIAGGETVVRRGELLTSRETGVLAAVGVAQVDVVRRPRVAVIATGDELLPPGAEFAPGRVYDSNSRILVDALRELGADATPLGIVPDDLVALRTALREALGRFDIVLLSGGTSKGDGDLSYRAVGELTDPGIVAHGVALKPGKPICLAASRGKPVVILPGFPTSAIFTFHEFVAPIVTRLGGRDLPEQIVRQAELAVPVRSEPGRTEYLLVGLVPAVADGDAIAESVGHGAPSSGDVEASTSRLIAYPMGKGSGSVTSFSRADGFVTIGRHEERIDAGTTVRVRLLGAGLRIADLTVIGSHCVGLDLLLGRMQARGWHVKFLAVGSTGGLRAAERGECDLAGIHLLDPATGEYNRPLLPPQVALLPGYGRRQGVVFRRGDPRFEGRTAEEAVRVVAADGDCLMVNRNQGSGTRILIDQLLVGLRPAGYAVQSRSHNAVAAAVAQGRADWGVAIEAVATSAGLGFLPLRDEHYDFAVPYARLHRPAVIAFQELLADHSIRASLAELGLSPRD